MDHLKTIGQILTGEHNRDAVHMAVAPVVAAARLVPGDHVGIDSDGKASESAPHIGIVDPFLRKRVAAGEQFWLMLYPGSIQSLRHEWTHPAFLAQPDRAIAEARRVIQTNADAAGIDFDEIIEAANSYLDRGHYLNQGSRWEGHDLDDDFWPAFEIVTGRKVPTNDRCSFFSCAC